MKTPKVMVKENEHYKTLVDCNKQLEKILKDLRLTPDARAIEFFYELLANNGIKEVYYYSLRDNFEKHYGYFII